MNDASQILLNQLSSKWTSSNTDGNTPQFAKVTSYKRLDFNITADWVVAHRPNIGFKPAGVGRGLKNKNAAIMLDVRTWGYDREAHFHKVVGEVERILDGSFVLQSADYTILDPDADYEDASDKTRGVWRMLIKNVNMWQYATARGTL
jgi:hypothetical protein